MSGGTIIGEKIGAYGVEIDWTASAGAQAQSVSITVFITYNRINIGARTGSSSIAGTAQSFTTAAIDHDAGEVYRKQVATQTVSVPLSETTCEIFASFPFTLTSENYGEVGTLTASQTVTLGEAAAQEEFDPEAFLRGWLLGKRIAGTR